MPNRPLRVVLIRPRNPLNIGACARAMANFGWTDLVVVEPYEVAWQETRSAPEAESVVLNARAVSTWDEAVDGCPIVLGTSSFHQRPKDDQAVVELPNLHKYLSPHPSSRAAAIVFGSERSGLSNEELSRCQAILRIPTAAHTPSVNLGQAVAIALYEWRREGWEPPMPPGPAPADELETLIQSMGQLGESNDYPPGYTAEARMGRVRKALQEAILPPATVRYLLSLTRWMMKKSL